MNHLDSNASPFLEEILEGEEDMVDQTSLQLQIQKNKESLEKKLLARRPMTTLVAQGIMPEYKTSPSLHLQKTKLERAKMGDMLKSRICHRPERSELIHRHILEDMRPGVDPSLCDRQRQLKRAKLADSLANQLSLRPGPLELIQKNILHTDDPVEQAIKDGAIQFKPTIDGAPLKPGNLEDQSGEMTPSPQNLAPSSPSLISSEPLSPNIEELISQFKEPSKQIRSTRSESLGDIHTVQPPPYPNAEKGSHLARSGSFGGLAGAAEARLSKTSFPTSTSIASGASSKERKKLKAKKTSNPSTATKPKLKFHEYKGPPTSLKRKKSDKSAEQSAYELLLEQQQLFLQWQLENRGKFSQIILPATGKSDLSGRASTMSCATSSTSGYLSGASSGQASSIVTSPSNSIPGTPRSTTPRASTPTMNIILSPQDVNNATSLLNKVEDMKVHDLKQELKKRNLPVSGSKQSLIERLKPALEAVISAGRQQFKQPYKQITIPHGGLIILKPSPNSVLTNNSNDEQTAPNQSSHEGTPDIDIHGMRSITQVSHYSDSCSPQERTFNQLSEVSSTENSMDSFCERKRSNSSNPEIDHRSMEVESSVCSQVFTKPPPPPPPPPQKTHLKLVDPKPLPQTPIKFNNCPASVPYQFLPPQTSTQIMMTKAQIEAQLNSSQNSNTFVPSNVSKAGPKGQFVWPPVNIQSSQGSFVTIRAGAAPGSMDSAAADLLQSKMTLNEGPGLENANGIYSTNTSNVPFSPFKIPVQLPSEPIPASELGISLPSSYNIKQDVDGSSNIQSTNLNGNHVFSFKKTISDTDHKLTLLPATLPSPKSNKYLSQIIEEQTNANDSLDQMNPKTEEIPRTPNDIIKEQQQRIIDLQKALDASNQKLLSIQDTPETVEKYSIHNNTKQLLAQQIQNKQIARQATQQHMRSLNNEETSINDVMEVIMQTGDVPESVERFGKQNQVKRAETGQNQQELPHLDFDFGLLPDFPEVLPDPLHTRAQQGTSDSQMEVDTEMDVQDWLDSLVAP